MPKNIPSNKEKTSRSKMDVAIAVAIITLIGTIAAAILNSPVLLAMIQQKPEPSIVPAPLPIQSTIATDPLELSPTPEPALVNVRVGDAKWRGPENTCTVEINHESFNYMPVADLENISPSNALPQDYYYPGHAVVSFDLSADQKIKISDIFVEVISYQPPPTLKECLPTPGALGEAHLFMSLINRPDIAGTHRFPAYLVSEDGSPGFVWLDPNEPISFFLLINAQTAGLYEIRCCDIELSQLDTKKIVQIDATRQILFLAPSRR
jgi:hypothetical protein